MTPTRLTLKSLFPCNARLINSPNFFLRSYTTAVKSKKLMIYEFGDPAKVVKLEEENLKPPGSNEVLIEMIVASMNPADMNTIQGTYPIKPNLPGVPGHEGVGKVIAIGAGVNDFFAGDLVIPNIENFGTWRTHSVVPISSVLKVPKNVPLIELSGISSNTSTAYRMLKDFVPLSPGDCVLQNGANSAAGQNVIQFCKAWGYKSVNIVRNRPDIDKLKSYLINLGATHVLTEEELRSTQLFKSGEIPSPKLALNCVGGKSASEVMRRLSQKGVVVTYGGMSREPVIIPTSLLIFKDISAKGFWMTRWTKENRDSEVRKYMFSDIMNLIVAGKLKAPAHSLIPLSKYAEALQNITNPKGFTGTKYIIDFRLEKS
uniref:Enoyl-[acyl-carrier-protein] reductase, mitochondrial n=1 Tax=Triatoma dimidiata TaxID=72491 RepID=A0A0V0GB45_TRIDM